MISVRRMLTGAPQRYLAARLTETPSRTLTLGAGIALAAMAFGVLSLGVLQPRLDVNDGVDWLTATQLAVEMPSATPGAEQLRPLATPNVRWTAPVEIVGRIPDAPSPQSRQTASVTPLAGYLILGIDPDAQIAASGLPASVTWGRYLRSEADGPSTMPLALAGALRGDPAAFASKLGVIPASAPPTSDAAAIIVGLGAGGESVHVAGLITPNAVAALIAPLQPGLGQTSYAGVLVLSRPDAESLVAAAPALAVSPQRVIVADATGGAGTQVHAERLRSLAEALLLHGSMVTVSGQALGLVATIDLTSAVLVALILLVGAAFVISTTRADLSYRGGELEILRRVGWSRSGLIALLLLERCTIALPGAVLAGSVTAIAAPFMSAADQAPWSFLVPAAAALGLTILGVLIAEALAQSGARRPRRHSVPVRHTRLDLFGLAIRSVRTMPVRTVIGVLTSLASAVVLGGVVLAVSGYAGAVVLDVAGQPEALQIGGVDVAIAIALVALTAFGFANLTIISLSTRHAELRLLDRFGWTAPRRARLLMTETALIAGLGAFAGALALLMVPALVTGRVDAAGFGLVASCAAAVVASAVAAAFIATLLSRQGRRPA